MQLVGHVAKILIPSEWGRTRLLGRQFAAWEDLAPGKELDFALQQRLCLRAARERLQPMLSETGTMAGNRASEARSPPAALRGTTELLSKIQRTKPLTHH